MFIQIGSQTWASLAFVPQAEVRIPRKAAARAHFLVINKGARQFYLSFDTRGGGTPHMKGVGMLVGNFELNP